MPVRRSGIFNIFVNDLGLKVKNNNKIRTVMKFISDTGLEMFLYPGGPRRDKDGPRRDVSEKQHQNYSVGIYIVYDSIYMTFCKWQNCRDRTQIRSAGIGGRGTEELLGDGTILILIAVLIA